MAKQRVEVEIITEAKNAIKSVMGYAAAIGISSQAVSKAISAVKDMVAAYSVQEEAERRLEQAIRTTGRAHEVSSQEMFRYAAELQKVTSFGDEVTISAMAMLQQLADLNQEGLQEVTPAVMDFASAMGMNLNTAASLVGRTLGGSTNLLTRYGVHIDMAASETDRLSELTEALNEKFGGMSAVLRETTDGSITAFNNAWGDSQEILGGFAESVIRPVREGLITLITALNQTTTANMALRESLGYLSDGLIGEGEDAGVPELEEARDAVENLDIAIASLEDRLDASAIWLALRQAWAEPGTRPSDQREQLAELRAQREAQMGIVRAIESRLGAEEAQRLAAERALRQEEELREERLLSIRDLKDEKEAREAMQVTIEGLYQALRAEINATILLRDSFEDGSEEYILAQSQIDLLAEARLELRALQMDAAEFGGISFFDISSGAAGDLSDGIRIGPDQDALPRALRVTADEFETAVEAAQSFGEELVDGGPVVEWYIGIMGELREVIPTVTEHIISLLEILEPFEAHLKDVAFAGFQSVLGIQDLEHGMASYLSTLMANMDRILFDMAWAAFKAGDLLTGIYLLGASGLVAFTTGLGQKAGAQEGWVFGEGGGHSPIAGGNNNNFYVQGSLIHESELSDVIMGPVTASRANH